MEKPIFLPQEATPEQRHDIADRAIASAEAQAGPLSKYAYDLYARYVVGEITLDMACAQIGGYHRKE